MTDTQRTDVAVVGAGFAGMAAAVRLADQGQLAAAQGALAEELGTLREALTSDTQFGRADRADVALFSLTHCSSPPG